jgi:MFS family permease
MISKLTDTNKSQGFYGWIALSGAMFSLITACIFVYSFGVFLPVLSDKLNWSRAAIATALSLGRLSSGLPSPLWGIIVARFGPRICIILGNTIAAAGLAGLYFLHDLWYLYLLFIFIGLGTGLGGSISSLTIANNWFSKRVSIAQGLVGSVAGIAGFVFPPLITVLIATFDWRPTWLILGGIIFAVGVVLGGVILVRNKPEDLGQAPDGVKPEILNTKVNTKNIPVKNDKTPSWPVKKILKMPVTWFIFVFGMSNGVVWGIVSTHQVAYMKDIGFTAMTAATTMSVLAVGSIIASLAFGALALRISIRYIGAAAFISQLLGMIILLTTRDLGWLYISSALVGMGFGALLTAMPIFMGAYFGRRVYAQLVGLAMGLNVAAIALAGMIGGIIYDARGSYTMAFVIVLCVTVIGTISVFLARKPALV